MIFMMKKFVSILLVLVLLGSFTSCAHNTLYNVYEIWEDDYLSEAKHTNEIDLATERYRDENATKEKKVSFNGKVYTVSYKETKRTYLFQTELEYYTKVEDGSRIEFGYNKANGRMDRYAYIDVNYLKKASGSPKSKEECLAIAKAYFGTFADDVYAYTLVSDDYISIPEFEAIYDFKFVRKIDGVETSDKASISVTVYGDIISHVFANLGEMKDAKLPSEAAFDEIEKNINDKMKSIYGSLETSWSFEYQQDEVTFVKLSDGNLALIYSFEVTLTPSDLSAKSFVERTQLLVYLE